MLPLFDIISLLVSLVYKSDHQMIALNCEQWYEYTDNRVVSRDGWRRAALVWSKSAKGDLKKFTGFAHYEIP